MNTILVTIPQTHVIGHRRQQIFATVTFATTGTRNVIQGISFEPEDLLKIIFDEVLIEEMQMGVDTYMQDSSADVLEESYEHFTEE